MIAEERYRLIMEELRQHGLVKSAELKRSFGISSETVRKDLEELERRGLLARVHGGAKQIEGESLNANITYIPFSLRQKQQPEAKCSIAQTAATLVKEKQCVGLDSGTTTLEIAKALKRQFQNLTIVTNSLATVIELSDCKGFTIICTGGVLRPDEYSFVSEFATAILEQVNMDIMFLTACGVTPDGITDQRIDEVMIHSRMARNASRVVVVSDSTKFEKPSLVRVCALDDIDTIITDRGVAEAALLALGPHRNKVIFCD